MNIIFGAGGVARELAWLLSERAFDDTPTTVKPDAFCVPDAHAALDGSLDGIPVLGEDLLQAFAGYSFNAYIAVGAPSVKRRIFEWLEARFNCAFPSVVHRTVPMDRRPGKTKMGHGVFVYPGATITTEVDIGDFVHINPCATIGHQARIGPGSTICPGANISGRVLIGKGCFVGAGAVVKDGVQIADNCLIGAGAVVTRDIPQAGTWAGVPARKIE